MEPAVIPIPDMLVNCCLRKFGVAFCGRQGGMTVEILNRHQRYASFQHKVGHVLIQTIPGS